MIRRSFLLLIVVLSAYLAGCASVPMAPPEMDQQRKTFAAPPAGQAGLYIYRNSRFGASLTKVVYVDGVPVGATAPMTFFYKVVSPGDHTLSTQSEFSNNDLVVKAEPNTNYFIRQYIKMGVFVGGANLELVSEEDGKKGVLECSLAQ